METKPTAPKKAPIQALETTELIAPLLDCAAAPEAVVDPFEVEATEVEAAAIALVEVEAIEPVTEPPMGAVDCPATSAETEELKVPVMPAIVNKAEKDITGYPLLLESVRLFD